MSASSHVCSRAYLNYVFTVFPALSYFVQILRLNKGKPGLLFKNQYICAYFFRNAFFVFARFRNFPSCTVRTHLLKVCIYL
jgi:hypothetical protein